MKQRLFESELKLMELLWENEPVSAKELSLLAAELIGWNKNTTYTVIKKLVNKEVISRKEPNFICTSIVKKEDVQKAETENLINKIYNGSKKALFSALLGDENLSMEDIKELQQMLDKRKGNN